MSARLVLCVTLGVGVAVCGIPGAPVRGQDLGTRRWTTVFPVEPLSPAGSNPYFVLEPGHTLVLEGPDGRRTSRVTIPVLDETRVVDAVETRVVEERETLDGELVEVSRNFFAVGARTNSVYYFGEDVDIYEDGQVVSHDGAWLSGVGGARYGLIMPGVFLLGSRYYQEVAPGVALDRAENVALGEEVVTPAGTFANAIKIKETTPLEPGARDFKYYAPGVGLVKSNRLVLIDAST